MENQSLYISNFKYFFKHLFFLLLIFLTLISTIGLFFERFIIFNSKITGASKINRILNYQYTNEIPIFGSSRAQGSYCPLIIGDNVFNYGIDGVSSNIWLFFLEQELKKDKKSHIIINFDLSGFNDYVGSLSNYIPNYRSTKNLVGLNKNFKYNIPGIKYFGYYEYYFKSFLNEKMNLTKITQNGGSFEKNTLIEKKFNKLIIERNYNPDQFTINEIAIKKFENLIKSTNRRIFVVIAPYHISYLNNFDNIDVVNEFLSEISKNDNLIIIDFRNEFTDNDLFFNTTHLNYKGALQFSKILKNKIHSFQ